MKILITGGAGFIGSAVVRYLLTHTDYEVINADKLTYAGNLDSLAGVDNNPKYSFEKIDICNREGIASVFRRHLPNKIMHLAAESHVDRSIDGASDFINTNIVGTFVLLDEANKYFTRKKPEGFVFHHVSTDEVYGDLDNSDELFTEQTCYAPSSPYSASKASSDHLVRAWHRTFGLPVVITNCSNNYGPYQFPEKLIPLVILNALKGKGVPVYGDGSQIRDWLYVDDHVKALVKVIQQGINGETYNIGGHNEIKNIDVVNTVCDCLDKLRPDKPDGILKYAELISYVKDRPGHDVRYAIDAAKMNNELGWKPGETFATGILKTVKWYLDNLEWCRRVQDGSYMRERSGLAGNQS